MIETDINVTDPGVEAPDSAQNEGIGGAIKALIEVNRDFFSHRVAPLLGLQAGQPVRSALAGAVGEAVRTIGAGPTPSSN